LQVSLAIKEAKASTSAIILPKTIISLWSSQYVSTASVILGPLAPLTFWSHYEASRTITKWIGTADYNLLKHPEEVEIHKLAVEQVCTSLV
jgi:hypothetical protein